ncbi:hypothetical protein [Streptomyces gobiensis]|uniref:hypothetical protein n=1 Tax=Streptomyces gobiensis TaxID=2875706 RepID=UPI001E3BF81C|nr:hypothetical protein [Streptomyces gobiensis]UGY94573.1 hypothetical protein test1122_24470 [Streptomyces gobiensis]
MIYAAELPWLVHYTDEPPSDLGRYTGSVVQAPRLSGMDSLRYMRHNGQQVGGVLVCLIHELVQIPIAPGVGPWRWPPTATLCRPRTMRCSAADGSNLAYRPCPGRFWLLPHDTREMLTDGAGLYDVLCTVRSLRRQGRSRELGGLNPLPSGPRESPDDLCRRWTS